MRGFDLDVPATRSGAGRIEAAHSGHCANPHPVRISAYSCGATPGGLGNPSQAGLAFVP